MDRAMMLQTPQNFPLGRRRYQRGYVLLMTLLLLTLVATAMAAACRMSLSQALAADESERLLRERWEVFSCQQTLLTRCEPVLVAEELRTGRPAISAHRAVSLCGETVDLIFTDESAKPNARSLLLQLGKSDAQMKLRELLSGTGIAGKVHLRPANFRQKGATHIDPELGSYGAVLDGVEPAELLQTRYGLSCPADLLTCWGDGRLNWLRASELSLRQCLTPALNLAQIQTLIDMRVQIQQLIPINLQKALDACELNTAQRNAAAARLREQSNCHALWTLLHNRSRTNYAICIENKSTQPASVSTFEW